MIIPGLLTNLCRTELADSISVSEPGAVGDSGGGRTAARGEKVEAVRGGQLCVSHLFNVVILPKVMTQPYWDFHSAFRCS